MRVVCPYCGADTVLIKGSLLYGSNSDASDLNFWICWPCDAYVGCHRGDSEGWDCGTKPLGTPAKKELRMARAELHGSFDKLWTEGRMRRTNAYSWLAKRLGISVDECHIGMFDVDTCKRAMVVTRDLSKIFG